MTTCTVPASACPDVFDRELLPNAYRHRHNRTSTKDAHRAEWHRREPCSRMGSGAMAKSVFPCLTTGMAIFGAGVLLAFAPGEAQAAPLPPPPLAPGSAALT
jgi:hypothetical protein